MALSANSPRTLSVVDRHESELPVKGSAHIFAGSAVTAASGVLEPLVVADGVFVGFATREANNSAGSDAAINVNVVDKGYVTIPVVGVTGNSNFDAAVYASDDNTFTLTSTSN